MKAGTSTLEMSLPAPVWAAWATRRVARLGRDAAPRGRAAGAWASTFWGRAPKEQETEAAAARRALGGATGAIAMSWAQVCMMLRSAWQR